MAQPYFSRMAFHPLGILLLLMVFVFVTELTVMEVLLLLGHECCGLVDSLIDASALVILTTPALWYIISYAGPRGGRMPRKKVFILLAELLAVVFLVELVVMQTLPNLLPAGVSLTVVDAGVTTLVMTPLFWWLVYRNIPIDRRQRFIEYLFTPACLYALLLLTVFLSDMLETFLLPVMLDNGNRLSHKVTDGVLTTLFAAPLIWWLVIRPLKVAAKAEKIQSDAIRSQAGDAIITLDADGTIESVNPAAESIFDYAADQLTGRFVGGLLAEGEDLVARLMAWEESSGPTIETLALRRDGSTITVEILLSKVFLGGWQQFVVIMRDISRRKEMENALRESEERFRSLSESSPVGVFFADIQGNCIYTNDRWHQITGLPASPISGLCWIDAVHDEDREIVAIEWKEFLAGGAEFRSELRLMGGESGVRWVVTKAKPVHADDAGVVGYVGVIEDITDVKRSEQEMQKSLSLLSATLESTADGILVVDTGRRVQTYNSKFLSLWRLSATEIEPLGDSANLLPKVTKQLKDPEAILARTEEVYFTPDRSSFDVINFTDGTVVERYSQPQLLDGRIVGRVWSYRDITAQKRAEKALRESEQRFRQIFEQTEDAIILFKPGTCQVIDANPTSERLFGFTKGDLQRDGLENFSRSDDYDRLCGIIRNVSHGATSHVDRIESVHKEGTKLVISMHGKLITIQGVDLCYCTFRDITDRVRMEEEARSIQAKLIQANKMTSLGLLVSGVAHEINNPNNFILSNSQLLLQMWQDALKILREYHEEHGVFDLGGLPFSEVDQLSPEMFAGIIEGTRRINEIVNNLKNFSRQDRRQAERPVDVNQVVKVAVQMVYHEIKRHTSNFHMELDRTIPHPWGSNKQLEQVVINLLMNACQALPDKQSEVRIATAYDQPGGYITITVSDAGVGIPRNMMARIMEPFFTTKLASGGTGLGLSICHSIVKDHHGLLECDSRQGEGTVFTVKLPARRRKNSEH